MIKTRLDLFLVNHNLAESREKAKSYIMEGNVYINNQKCTKAGMLIPEDEENVEVRAPLLRYVSRGGLKLEKAMSLWPITLTDKICMDIGASTGGFTDCMLINGASKVYAVDVGYGQLAWSLRQDPRVVNMERTNIRFVTADNVPDALDFISIDVSFISLCLVLPVAKTLLKDGAEAVILIKPQFEAGKNQVGKKGVVRDRDIHYYVVNKIVSFATDIGFTVKGLSFSPIKGPEGNIEYLAYLKNESSAIPISDDLIKDVISESHAELDSGLRQAAAKLNPIHSHK